MAEGEKCSYGPTLKKWLSNAMSWTKDVQSQNLSSTTRNKPKIFNILLG